MLKSKKDGLSGRHSTIMNQLLTAKPPCFRGASAVGLQGDLRKDHFTILPKRWPVAYAKRYPEQLDSRCRRSRQNFKT